MDVKKLLKKFVKYQIEWLTMHDDVEFEPEEEQLIIKFLKDTEKCFMLENKDLPSVTHAEKQEPCNDVISRHAVIGVMVGTNNNWLIDKIKALPPVKPVEKVGQWEWVQYDSNPNIGNWHCSECRTIIPHMPEETDNTPIYKWCPMCRAKMQEVEV